MKMKIVFAVAILACFTVIWQQAKTLHSLRAENALLQQRVAALNGQTYQISDEDSFRLREWHIEDALKVIGLTMKLYAEDNNHQYATNFDQLVQAEYFTTRGKILTNFVGGISIYDFEIQNAGKVNNLMTNVVILREVIPHTAPNGWWYRSYYLANVGVETVYGDEKGNNAKFAQFEREHSVSTVNQ